MTMWWGVIGLRWLVGWGEVGVRKMRLYLFERTVFDVQSMNRNLPHGYHSTLIDCFDFDSSRLIQ